jgi:hypothetical protein
MNNASSITFSKYAKADSKTIYIMEYKVCDTRYMSICLFKEGKFAPIPKINDINGAIINQSPIHDIEDFLSISNLNNILEK